VREMWLRIARVEFVAVAAALEATMSPYLCLEKSKRGRKNTGHGTKWRWAWIRWEPKRRRLSPHAIGGREEEMTHGSSARRAVAVAMPRSMKISTAWLLPVI
jgi:hypothetical protein